MYALTIKQPHVGHILEGRKTREYRTWTTGYRGLLLLHASRTRDMDAYRLYDRDPDGDPTGVLLAVCTLVDIESRELGPRIAPRHTYAWILSGPLALPQPIPYRGQRGLFTVPDDLIR